MGVSWLLELLSQKVSSCGCLSGARQWQMLVPDFIWGPLGTCLGFLWEPSSWGSLETKLLTWKEGLLPVMVPLYFSFLLPKAQGPDQNIHCYKGRAIQLLWGRCFMFNFYCCFYRTLPPPDVSGDRREEEKWGSLVAAICIWTCIKSGQTQMRVLLLVYIQ